MAARVPTMLFLGVATVAAAGAMYFVPDVSASEDNAHIAPVVAEAVSAPAAERVAQMPTADDSNCKAQAWPYLSASCDADGSARAARSRQVRVISTDRDAPRAVPLPAAVAAAVQPEPAVGVAEGAGVSILPPARPAELASAQGADGTAPMGDVDATGSVKPAPAVVAPARRRVARAARTIRPDDRNLDMDQVATYRDAYGREFIVRAPVQQQQQRQAFADDGMGARYGRPMRNDNPLAWLTGSQF